MFPKRLKGPLAGFVFLLALPAAQAASVADWQADLDAIVRDIRTIHPNAFTKTKEADFLARAAALEASLGTLSEEQRVVQAMQLVATIGDGHTQLAPNTARFALWYPVRVYQFTDGYFITSAYKTVADLAGARILTIAGRPVEEVMENVRTLMGADNHFGRGENLFAVNSSGLMKGLGYAASDGTLKMTVALRSGARTERTLTPLRTSDTRFKPNDATFEFRFGPETAGTPIGTLEDWTSAYKALPAIAFRTPDLNRPAHLMFRRWWIARAYPDKSSYYIQANLTGNEFQGETFGAFFKKSLAEVDHLHPKSLIIDLRYNFGGDGSKVPAVIHEFIKREDNPPWGHLYVLTGRKTFSAALMMLAAFIDHTRFSIIGEPAGAYLDSFGDATTVDLPRTGLELDVSTLWHQLEDQGAHYAVMPVDVPAPFSFKDWSEGRDPAVDAIFRGDEMRSIPMIALEDGAAAARKAWDDRRKRYQRLAEWAAPREIDFIHAGWKLEDKSRTADMLGVYQIAIEAYPDSPRILNYLGAAEIAVGRTAEGLAHYRRALALDPNNLDNLDQRAALARAEIGLPALAQFGASLANTRKALEGKCAPLNVRRIDPPFLENIKDKQMQIDCEGFVFAGLPRHAEFVIGDDALKMIWIMVAKAELATFRQQMISAYGPPTSENAAYVAFARDHTALRIDKAEFLFYAPELGPAMEPEFAEGPAN